MQLADKNIELERLKVNNNLAKEKLKNEALVKEEKMNQELKNKLKKQKIKISVSFHGTFSLSESELLNTDHNKLEKNYYLSFNTLYFSTMYSTKRVVIRLVYK